jgi:hypothetical protein
MIETTTHPGADLFNCAACGDSEHNRSIMCADCHRFFCPSCIYELGQVDICGECLDEVL